MEASEILVPKGSNAVVAVDFIVVRIIVAIALVVGPVNYSS